MSTIREFRGNLLNEIDAAWDNHDGETPDHIILSKEIYDQMREKRRFENLKDNTPPKRPGYLGMKVWWSYALDKRDTAALLISNEVFEHIVTRAEDFKRHGWPKDF